MGLLTLISGLMIRYPAPNPQQDVVPMNTDSRREIPLDVPEEISEK